MYAGVVLPITTRSESKYRMDVKHTKNMIDCERLGNMSRFINDPCNTGHDANAKTEEDQSEVCIVLAQIFSGFFDVYYFSVWNAVIVAILGGERRVRP